MRRLIYSMGVSLDGLIAGPGGEIGWSAPDEELHAFHNEQALEIGVYLYGRRLYELMTSWETAEENPSSPEHELEFARIWKRIRKIVFSGTLDRLFIYPAVLGGGIPFFPPLEEPIKLRLAESRTFGMGVVYVRYQAV